MKTRCSCMIGRQCWWNASVSVATILGVLSGCNGPKGQPSVDNSIIDGSPGISTRVSELSVGIQEKGETVRMEDFIMVLPQGWSISVKKTHENGDLAFALRGRYKGHNLYPVYVGYRKEVSWVTSPPDTLRAIAEKYVDDANMFFGMYDTDLKFFLAVSNATPDDRDKASGRTILLVKLLLVYKKCWGGAGNAKLLRSDGLTALISPVRLNESFVGSRVFDKKGLWRAGVSLESPVIGWPEAQEVLGALLVNSRFDEGASDTNTSGSQGPGQRPK
jgi:hypothetical protein